MQTPTMARLVGTAAAVLLVAGAAQAQSVTGPFDLTATVKDIHNPGGTVYSDSQVVFPATPDPKLSAELLYRAPIGANFSGHATSIPQAFTSALAESDGNGGVGVSSWIAGSAVPGTPATDSLVAQAVWGQSFTYLGSVDATIKLHYEIPKLIVGLIGVAPNRDSVSKTETTQAMVTLTSFVTHADGSTTTTGGFEYGAHVEEYQILLGSGFYANYADITITDTAGISPTLTLPDDPYNPEWSFDPVHGDRTLATLAYGDTLTYQYTLTATGSTLGGEHGYYAFVGDPFGVDVVSGNLGIVTTPVPEPGAWALMASGLVWLGWRRRARR